MISCRLYSTLYENMSRDLAFGVKEPGGRFEVIPVLGALAELGPDHVEVEVKFCGVCYTDVSGVDNLLGSTAYPCVPGHEMAGLVTRVGERVIELEVADKVGIGCIVDSCLECDECAAREEHHCQKGFTMAFGCECDHGHVQGCPDTGQTLGGFRSKYVVHQRFAIPIPELYPLQYAAPLMCAGVTGYSALKKYGCLEGGKSVGVIGLGGLGQTLVKLARACGNQVSVISSEREKEALATKRLKCDSFSHSGDKSALARAGQTLDVIINTSSASPAAERKEQQSMLNFLPLLKRHGVFVELGISPRSQEICPLIHLQPRSLSISGSMIGSIQETKEVVRLCAQKAIYPDIEEISRDQLDDAFAQLRAGNRAATKYVLNMTKSRFFLPSDKK